MTELDFIRMIQSRAARIAVGPSTVRGRGNAGSVTAARNFLRRLDLSAFGVNDADTFASELDRATEMLRTALPHGAQHWGIARKALNIFLRDCFYTSYLMSAFHLDRVESFLELPLDSITAKRLCDAPSGTLLRWPGVKHLTAPVSEQLQRVAADEARKLQIARVHLDAFWWSVARDDDAT
jgi:hypothetical protein